MGQLRARTQIIKKNERRMVHLGVHNQPFMDQNFTSNGQLGLHILILDQDSDLIIDELPGSPIMNEKEWDLRVGPKQEF